MNARRSPIVILAVNAATPVAAVIAVYLLFAGHNRPGGGFAAGLLVGAVLVLRTVSGVGRPRHAIVTLAAGGVVTCVVAMLPMVWGDELLNQAIVEVDLPVLGTVKTGTALVFDIGVMAIVIGLVMAVLEGLGAAELGSASASEPAGAASGEEQP